MLRRPKKQEVLKEKTVTIIGVGGIGANISLQLTQAGIKKIRLVDFDRVELCNLNRGQVFTYNDIGKYKIEVAAKNVEKVNPSAAIETIVKEMCSYEDIAAVIDGVDFVVRCADKPAPYFNEWFNRACIDMDKPFITGGMNEYVGLYGPLCIPRRTACMECSGTINFNERLEVFNANSAMSPSWGPIMGFIGDLMANDIIAYLGGAITGISTNSYIIDASTMSIIKQQMLRNENCRSCGEG